MNFGTYKNNLNKIPINKSNSNTSNEVDKKIGRKTSKFLEKFVKYITSLQADSSINLDEITLVKKDDLSDYYTPFRIRKNFSIHANFLEIDESMNTSKNQKNTKNFKKNSIDEPTHKGEKCKLAKKSSKVNSKIENLNNNSQHASVFSNEKNEFETYMTEEKWLKNEKLCLLSSDLTQFFSHQVTLNLRIQSTQTFNYICQVFNKEKIICLFYNRPVSNDSDPKIPSILIGNLYWINSMRRTSEILDINVTLVHRVMIPYDPNIRLVQFLRVHKIQYDSIDEEEIRDILNITQDILFDHISLMNFWQTFSPVLHMADFLDVVLNNFAWNYCIRNTEREDVSGARKVIFDVFTSRNLQNKMEILLQVYRKYLITNEMSNRLDESKYQFSSQKTTFFLEHLLRQQIESDPNNKEILGSTQNLLDNIAEKISELPENVQPIAKKEFSYMKSLDKNSSEYTVSFNYLDWIVSLPWNKSTIDNYDISHAQLILEKTHYGLKDVKTQILHLVSNASRTGCIEGKPLLLLGPPGTGKTSIAKKIAESINRKYIHITGLTESPDLKGFRRTYVGSAPGKIINELRRVQSNNPVILIDEIDKICDKNSYKPVVPALLELLSPEQNKLFFDHYMDLPFDLSKAFFICTANSLDGISAPLLNRLKLIQLPSYSFMEKYEISSKYLIPAIKNETGLPNVDIPSETLNELIRLYSRQEFGVRQLKIHLLRIYRKLALKTIKMIGINKSPVSQENNHNCDGNKNECNLSKNQNEQLVLDPNLKNEFLSAVQVSDLKDLLGYPDPSEHVYPCNLVGVVIGLSKNMYGGSVLTIETIADKTQKGEPRIEFTGNIQETMNESSQIAYTYAKIFVSTYYPENDFFETTSIHVNAPHGAIKKDGPSAGCALACSFISVALNQPILEGVCMTGEISLTGKILAVGGIRDKTLAAVQAGMKIIILPEHNRSDFGAIPAELVSSITPHFVSSFESVYLIAFGRTLKKTRITKSKCANNHQRQPNVNIPLVECPT